MSNYPYASLAPKAPRGSELLMLFSDNQSNIYSVFSHDGNFMMSYDPMDPLRSCTGCFSGIPFVKEISKNQFSELENAFSELAKKKELHTFDRTKTSGLFTSPNDKFMVNLGDYDKFESIIKQHIFERPIIA